MSWKEFWERINGPTAPKGSLIMYVTPEQVQKYRNAAKRRGMTAVPDYIETLVDNDLKEAAKDD